jgi:Cu/Ag efflux pump CusA
LAQLNLSSDVATIPRVDGLRINEVKAYITAGTLPAQVISDFEHRMAASDFRLPSGYRIEYGGEAAKRDKAVQNLLTGVAMLVALIMPHLSFPSGPFESQ